MKKPEDSPRVAGTRVGNGRALFLENVDGRGLVARRFRELYRTAIADLGGEERVGEGQRQLARRFAALAVEAESLEARMADGEPLDLERYLPLTNALRRVAATLGVERPPDLPPPTLNDYLGRGQ